MPHERLTDCRAKKIEDIWKKEFPDASILPVIGYPEVAGNCVMTLIHTLNTDCYCAKDLRIDGLKTKSIWANNALFSTEISKCQFLNLYEVTLPDIPGECGEKSTVQFYIDKISEYGIQVSAANYHLTGAGTPFPLVVNSYNVGMCPEEFTCKTIKALNKTLALIQKRTECNNN